MLLYTLCYLTQVNHLDLAKILISCLLYLSVLNEPKYRISKKWQEKDGVKKNDGVMLNKHILEVSAPVLCK